MPMTHAERQAAYRERREERTQMLARLATEAVGLCRTIRNAADKGNPLAQEVCNKSDTQILKDLSECFREDAVSVRRSARNIIMKL